MAIISVALSQPFSIWTIVPICHSFSEVWTPPMIYSRFVHLEYAQIRRPAALVTGSWPWFSCPETGYKNVCKYISSCWHWHRPAGSVSLNAVSFNFKLQKLGNPRTLLGYCFISQIWEQKECVPDLLLFVSWGRFSLGEGEWLSRMWGRWDKGPPFPSLLEEFEGCASNGRRIPLCINSSLLVRIEIFLSRPEQ